MEVKSELIFYVNGKLVTCTDINPKWTLLWYIRNKLFLTGSKLSCGKGACGACTVMISEKNRTTSKIKHYAVNACVYPLVQVHGKAVTTVEGIGSTRTSLHPIQERLAKCHGTQCGFCSPGMVMSMYSLMRNSARPTHQQIQEAIAGNFCRCTGYRPIIQAFKTFSDNACPMGENCCQNQSGDKTKNVDAGQPSELVYDTAIFRPVDPTQDFIFPNELQLSKSYHMDELAFEMYAEKWFRPATLMKALKLKSSQPKSRWVMGNLSSVTSPADNTGSSISVGHLEELQGVSLEGSYLHIGAATTLSDLQQVLRELKEGDDHPVAESLLYTLKHWKSGQQIKNMATIGGNILVGSKTSTFLPLLMMLNAELDFVSLNAGHTQQQTHKLNNKFSLDVAGHDSLLTEIRIPITFLQKTFLGVYFAEQQTHLGGRSPCIQGVFKAEISDDGHLTSFCAAIGGLHDYPQICLSSVESKTWDETVLEFLRDWFKKEVIADYQLDNYLVQTSQNFFTKFYMDVQRERKQHKACRFVSLDPEPELLRSVHVWEPANERQSVGWPVMTQWALEHTTGEAKYCTDMSHIKDELYLSLVTSTKPHAKLVSVDPTAAFGLAGVIDFVSHKDVPGKNTMNAGLEEIFAEEEVTCVGRVIGAIVAETEEAAKKGAALVQVEYEELPAIMSIQEALDHGSFLDPDCVIQHGDVSEAMKDSWQVLEGEVELGGQEHFYMETNSAIVIPKQEYSQFDVYCTNQSPASLQNDIAVALGIELNRVTVHTRRLGGGFGGKEFANHLVTLPAAVAAYKHNKTVKISLDRGQDMQITGGRHPGFLKYKVGFTKDGKMQALDCELNLNGGDRPVITKHVVAYSSVTVDGSYYIPNVKVVGRSCKTNTVSNTAFRGFGIPQSAMVMNLCMEKIADQLGVDVTKIQELNLYKEGDITFYKHRMENCNIQKCFDLLMTQTNYLEKRKKVEEFNKDSHLVKRGVAVVPVKFMMSYDSAFLNQANALLNIYKDGSVLLYHGAIEMGQGVNIKAIQIAAETLGIPHERIIISETSTDATPNMSPTSASVSSDIIGGAVKNACDIMNERLKPVKLANPAGSWKQWVIEAYNRRISLSVAGHYSTPHLFHDPKKHISHYSYYSFGVASSMIQLDVLTGEHKLLGADIVFDVGKSLNPAIDIGQIEGAFLQGYGYYCLEEMLYNDRGELLNKELSYRLPLARDIPQVLNVTLLKDHPNEKAVYSSKGIGEPPLLSAASVYMAIRDAIKSVRKDKGLVRDFQLNVPACPRRVLHACTHN